MADNNGTPDVTMTNTKKEMMVAYSTVKQRLKVQEKELLNAERTRKQMVAKLAEVAADAQATQDPLQRLSALRRDISRELTGLADRFEQEIDTYNKLKAAIQSKQEELDTIYGVETAASDLAALIEAQRAGKEAFEKEMADVQSKLESEIQDKKDLWEQEEAARDQEMTEAADGAAKQHQREEEEFEYAFAREKAQKQDALADKLQTIEKDIAGKRESFDRESQARKLDLDRREEDIAAREEKMVSLEQEVGTFPGRLESAVEKAVSDAAAGLTRDFEKDKALMASQSQGEKNVLAGKIEALEKLAASQAAQIADIGQGREDAYGKVQDIANRAIAAAKREIISIPVSTRLASTSDED